MNLRISKNDRFVEAMGRERVGSYYVSVSGFDNVSLNIGKYNVSLCGDIHVGLEEAERMLCRLEIDGLSAAEIVDKINERIDGRYALVLRNDSGNEVFISNDKYGRQDIFYLGGDDVYVSDDMESLRALNGSGFSPFAVAHTIITTTGPRPPKKHTVLHDVKRLGLLQTLRISDSRMTVHQGEYESKRIQNYGTDYLKTHSDIYLNTIENLGSDTENIVYLSSGWDSTAILASLNHIYGSKKIKAVTWRLRISERSGEFNRFEIERAKKFCDYYGIPLHIVDTDYVIRGKQLYSEVQPFLQKYGYYGYTAFSHYYVAKKASEIKETDDCVLFSGEISDGAYNLGFSQYISTFHPSPGFREYSDKMLSYLFGPTFLKECLKGKGADEPIYQFFMKRHVGKEFDDISRDEEKLIKQILISFFGRNERFPFLSIKNYSFLTADGMTNYDETLQSEYFDDLTNLSVDSIYSIILFLYNSFHWNGSSVNTLYSAAEYHGMRLRLPLYDPKMQDFLEQMPEDWGRGLDLNPVKYALKHYLANVIDYPMDLQSGPHSYLYDIDEEYLNPPFEWVMHSMKNVYKECLDSFDIGSLDGGYFNTDYLKKIVDDYNTNDHIERQDFQPLYGLLNLALTETDRR